jgi:peptidyl-dipeptidase Dcp
VKKIVIIIFGLALIAGSCKNSENQEIMKNPLLQEFATPFEVPPFNTIKLEDFAPAIREAIKVQNKEISDIVKNKKTPDFSNTIVAYEQSGSLPE